MDGIDDSKTPIKRVQGLFVFTWKIGLCSKHDIGRGTLANVNCGRQVVWVVGRPLGVAGSPAIFRSTGQVRNTRRTVPRHSKIPFHIRIVSENIPHFIVVKIKSVSVSCRNQFPVFSFWVYSSQPAPRRFPFRGMASRVFD